MKETTKITAQYFNGLAVAIFSVAGASFITGTLSGLAFGLALVGSIVLHKLALRVS